MTPCLGRPRIRIRCVVFRTGNRLEDRDPRRRPGGLVGCRKPGVRGERHHGRGRRQRKAAQPPGPSGRAHRPGERRASLGARRRGIEDCDLIDRGHPKRRDQSRRVQAGATAVSTFRRASSAARNRLPLQRKGTGSRLLRRRSGDLPGARCWTELHRQADRISRGAAGARIAHGKVSLVAVRAFQAGRWSAIPEGPEEGHSQRGRRIAAIFRSARRSARRQYAWPPVTSLPPARRTSQVMHDCGAWTTVSA